MHLRMLDRVLETYLVGVEADAGVGVGAGSAVFEVPFDGTSYATQLAANLVVAARKQFYLNEMIIVSTAEPAVIQPGQFGPRTLRGYVRLVLGLVLDEPVLQMPFRRLGLGAAKRPVGFVDAAFAQQRPEPAEGLAGLGEDADSADRPVEPVRNSQEDLPWLGVALRYEGLVGVREAFVTGLVALDYLSAALADCQQMVVFIKYAGRKVRILVR